MENIAAMGATIGVVIAIALVMPRLVSGQRAKLVRIDSVLRESGGMTLDQIAAKLGTSVFAKGYLMQALDALEAEGKLVKVPPPPGHPRMRIFKDTMYVVAAR